MARPQLTPRLRMTPREAGSLHHKVRSWRSRKPPPEELATNGTTEDAEAPAEKADKGKEREGSPVRKFRGIPENVKLFEIFWQQVVELIKVGLLRSAPQFPTLTVL